MIHIIGTISHSQSNRFPMSLDQVNDSLFLARRDPATNDRFAQTRQVQKVDFISRRQSKDQTLSTNDQSKLTSSTLILLFGL
ncbi:hypothetical protein BpHYR1_027890 [Brachionus plicatilis]|uniref:Uncharacterized protein n=1 Tax=Brachionus plicatilis TaxID=10195 RepID=A0A3M7PX39_BRAPC|nr:hypothetical protein BpHYR1_027890 [Brachionus plicatilis]